MSPWNERCGRIWAGTWLMVSGIYAKRYRPWCGGSRMRDAQLRTGAHGLCLVTMRQTVGRLSLALLAGVLAVTLPERVHGADFAGRPIRLLVGFTAGGTTDFIARLLPER